MKNSTQLLKIVFTTVLILFTLNAVAQDLYLPATTKSKEVKKLYEKAWDAIYNLDFTTSQKLTEEALQIEPNFFMGYYLSLFGPNNQPNKDMIDKIVNYKGKLNKAEKIIQEANIARKTDPKTSTIPYWKDLEKLYPKNIFVKGFLAYGYMNQEKNYEEALAYVNKGLDLKADFAPLYNTKGYIYLGMKKLPEAEKAFNRYIELAPEMANPYDSKGDYFMAVKKYQEAMDSYKKAYQIDNTFEISLDKSKRAKWHIECDKIMPKIDEMAKKMVVHYQNKDMTKFHSYFDNSEAFRYIYNGKENLSRKEMVDSDLKNVNDLKDFKLNITNQLVNMLSSEEAISSQKFTLHGIKKDDSSFDMEGVFNCIWKYNDKDGWKIIQVIENSKVVDKVQ